MTNAAIRAFLAAGEVPAGDPAHGYLQVGGLLIGEQGPYMSWGTLRTATGDEAAMAAEHPAGFWAEMDGRRVHRVYFRQYPLRSTHMPARVIPASQVLGGGTLRLRQLRGDPRCLTTAVIVAAGDEVLVPARTVAIPDDSERGKPGTFLSPQMRTFAAEYAAQHGYELGGVWACRADGTHEIGAWPENPEQKP